MLKSFPYLIKDISHHSYAMTLCVYAMTLCVSTVPLEKEILGSGPKVQLIALPALPIVPLK